MHHKVFRSVAARCSTGLSTRYPPRVARCAYNDIHRVAGGCYAPAFGFQKRLQSSADKKFHCSVCKKPFRLEMASKLHLQQAHGGDGSVESGPGPGIDTLPSSVSSGPAPPPTCPIEKTFVGEEERRPRRMRPTPKPLHQPDRDIPTAAMEEMLDVWNKVGVKRLEGNFIHSTMVMKVFAAPPDVSEIPLYDRPTPEGENPFESFDYAASDAVSTAYIGGEFFAEADLADPFVVSPDETLNPFRAAKVRNPFSRTAPTQREVSKPLQPSQTKEEPLKAPVTPFGQLPVFGKTKEEKASVTETGCLAQRSTNSNEVSSPFLATVANSPFVGQVASPFASGQDSAGSPFDGSPFAAASPFVTEGEHEPSPFATSPVLPSFGQSGSLPLVGIGSPGHPAAAQAEQRLSEPEHECPICGKKFSSFEGAAMHSKAKHGTVLEGKKRNNKAERKRAPDLPAYVPSPVDLSSTSPFGTKPVGGASWAETELVPHAQCVSNIVIVGRVLDVSQVSERVSHVTVFVEGERSGEEETLTLFCFGDITRKSQGALRRNATIFASGTLRLHPVYEASNNKYYMNPVVHVAMPTGTLAVIT